jgi:hypothetical protein
VNNCTKPSNTHTNAKHAGCKQPFGRSGLTLTIALHSLFSFKINTNTNTHQHVVRFQVFFTFKRRGLGEDSFCHRLDALPQFQVAKVHQDELEAGLQGVGIEMLRATIIVPQSKNL